MRLFGLASGFDTEAMVQNLMRVERMKVDRYTQNKQVNLWRQEDYNSVNRDIANFILDSKRNVGLSHVSSTGSIANKSWKNLDYVKKATSTKEDKISAQVIGSSMDGDFDIKIEKLATNARFDLEVGKTGNKLKDLLEEGQSTIKIAGIDIELDSILEKSKKESIEDLTVADLLKEVNSNDELKKIGVSAFYDKGTERIFIQGDPVSNENKNVDFVQGFKSDKVGNNSLGEFAEVTINGATIEGLKSNDVEFNGVKIDFSAASVKDEAKINVSTNTETIMDKIKDLVEEYNDLLDKINGKMSEERHKDFHPLSEDEKKEMSDRDVELWEEKAKSGMLRNDETLTRSLDKVRGDLYKKVVGLDGKFSHITEIGITTQEYSRGAAGGKLEINEDKLRAAIEDDAEGVMELLFGTGDKEALESEDSGRIGATNKGIFTGIYDNLIDGMKEIINKSGPGGDSNLLKDVRYNILTDFMTSKGSISDLDRNVRDLDKRIADMEATLIRREDAYYAQFSRMEKYIYEMNSQSQWLANQMM